MLSVTFFEILKDSVLFATLHFSAASLLVLTLMATTQRRMAQFEPGLKRKEVQNTAVMVGAAVSAMAPMRKIDASLRFLSGPFRPPP